MHILVMGRHQKKNDALMLCFSNHLRDKTDWYSKMGGYWIGLSYTKMYLVFGQWPSSTIFKSLYACV